MIQLIQPCGVSIHYWTKLNYWKFNAHEASHRLHYCVSPKQRRNLRIVAAAQLLEIITAIYTGQIVNLLKKIAILAMSRLLLQLGQRTTKTGFEKNLGFSVIKVRRTINNRKNDTDGNSCLAWRDRHLYSRVLQQSTFQQQRNKVYEVDWMSGWAEKRIRFTTTRERDEEFSFTCTCRFLAIISLNSTGLFYWLKC